MNEFALIRKYFAPLAEAFPGSLNLSDDAAILDIPEGSQLVITKDAISEKVHFLPGTDPALIAKKLLRTNLSDLASMGATPLCYFLAVALPKPISEDFIARFAEGLAEDQKQFSIHLAGGDTITSATPVFSLTAHGLIPKGKALRRSGAKAGDGIYVTGTLGDAALGLLDAREGKKNALTERYHLPQPRVNQGVELRNVASSCIDISDGLLQDAGHVAKASNVAMDIHLEQLPLSQEAREKIAAQPELLPLIYSGGDDYELLFTLPEDATPPFPATLIGRVGKGEGVRLLEHGKEIPVQRLGYSH